MLKNKNTSKMSYFVRALWDIRIQSRYMFSIVCRVLCLVAVLCLHILVNAEDQDIIIYFHRTSLLSETCGMEFFKMN